MRPWWCELSWAAWELALRPVSTSDTSMVALSLTDEIARWVGIDSVTTMKAGTPVWAASATELARRGESFRYLILRGGEFAGVIEVRPDREAGNIGYWLRRRARGCGTATLANHVAVLVAFDGLGLDAVEWTANGENDRSIAVMKRLGATFVDRRATPERADRSSEVRYRLARSTYRHLPDGPPRLDVLLP